MDDKNIYVVGEGGKAALGEQLAKLQRVAEKMGKEIHFVNSEADLPDTAHDVAPLPDIEDMFADMEAMLLTPNAPLDYSRFAELKIGPMRQLTGKERTQRKAKRKAARKARRKNR